MCYPLPCPEVASYFCPHPLLCFFFSHTHRAFQDAGATCTETVPRRQLPICRGFFSWAPDLGARPNSECYSYVGAAGARSARACTRDANQALIAIQLASRAGVLPDYDHRLLSRELALFPEWYLARHLGLTLDDRQQTTLQTAFAAILANNLSQTRVFVHRDYHSRNLMVVGDTSPAFPANPGVLDFQDAVYGPLTYDLVSLYRDAYIDWPEEQELDFVIRYWDAARQAGLPVHADFHDFYRDYEWMGAQRQLKVLGIFARLCHRDGKENYLADMPRVLHYLRRTCQRYGELRPLARLLDTVDDQPAVAGYTF
ncbi:phosphotransferase [Candidatus Accumulibacter sp. ACC003]|uniref:aminoglycoside phosphotransferase family protein n=1 Tax=Candidatus Accumulibacter sp. ACC003 TaxID=2823334 RepID=UPI00344DAE3C